MNMTKKQDKELYEKALKSQKRTGWILIVIGIIFTCSIIFAIFGIPLLLIGIGFVNSKKVNHVTAKTIRNTLEPVD